MKFNKQNIYKWILAIGLLVILVSIILDIWYIFHPISDIFRITSISVGVGTSLTLLVYTFYMYKSSIFDSIEDINRNSAYISAISPEKLEGGVLIYNDEGTITFVSDWLLEKGFKHFLGKNLKSLESKFVSDGKTTDIYKVKIDNNYFKLVPYPKTKSYFVKNVTEIENLNNFILDKQLALILVKIKFSSFGNFTENKKSEAEFKLKNFLENWTNNYLGIYKQGTNINEPESIVVYWKDVEKLFQNSDDFFFDLSKNLSEFGKFISISVGVSYGKTSLRDLSFAAREALTVSENRGGNQVVLQDKIGSIQAIGQSSEATTEDSRVKLKLFYDQLIEKLSRKQNIFITSHQMADLDAIGSSLGFAAFLREKINKKTFVILPELDDSALEAKKWINKRYDTYFLTEKEAIKEVGSKSVLIILDVSAVERTQAVNLFEKISEENRFIIDHHRTAGKIIGLKAENAFIDPSISSISEIITEFINFDFLTEGKKNFDQEIATLLLSGIYLDSNRLSRSTSSRTYEAVSFLTKLNANEERATKFIQENFEESIYLREAISKARKIIGNVLFVEFTEQERLDNSLISSIADKMLDYKDISASIVLAKVNSTTWKMSMRSNYSINSQLICEKLGGGGHFNTGAAIFDQKDYPNKKDITRLIISTVQDFIKSKKETNLKKATKKVKRK